MIRKEYILPYFISKDWEGLTNHLSKLSNADFRKAEQVVRDEILPTLPLPVFWSVLQRLVIYRKSAFITGLAALGQHTEEASFTLITDEARDFADAITEAYPDVTAKAINITLPLLTTEKQIDELFILYNMEEMHHRVQHLIKVESPLSYFVLFKTLKMLPENNDIVRQCCLHILHRGNDKAVNMANILRAYFDIENISIPTSVNISTYELSYLDRNYDTFLNILNGKRPVL